MGVLAKVSPVDLSSMVPRHSMPSPGGVPHRSRLAKTPMPSPAIRGGGAWHDRTLVRDGLSTLKRSAGTILELLRSIFRLLQEQVGERLDMPASAITEASSRNVFSQTGFPNRH
jgi:hypothetical protein